MDNAVALAAIALASTTIVGLFKMIASFTSALNALVAETKRGNDASEKRNGHLGEQSEKIAKLVVDAEERTIDAISHVRKQEVKEQHVHKEVVERKEVKK